MVIQVATWGIELYGHLYQSCTKTLFHLQQQSHRQMLTPRHRRWISAMMMTHKDRCHSDKDIAPLISAIMELSGLIAAHMIGLSNTHYLNCITVHRSTTRL